MGAKLTKYDAGKVAVGIVKAPIHGAVAGFVGAVGGFWWTMGQALKPRAGEHPNEAEMAGKAIAVEDVTTAICAALSCWVYENQDRALTVTEPTECWSFSGEDRLLWKDSIPEEMEVGDTEGEQYFTMITPDAKPMPVISTGYSEKSKRRWVAATHVFGNTVYLWQGEHVEFKTDIHCDVLESVRNLLNKRPGQRLVASAQAVVRAMWMSGGPLSPSAVSVVVKDDDKDEGTLYIAWQGTMFASRPMDLVTDLAAGPIRASLWHDLFPDTWAHSAIYAKVQSDVCKYEDVLVNQIIPGYLDEEENNSDNKEKRVIKVNRVVFTGHSLGGGCARVAHMIAYAKHERTPDLLKGVQLSSITFAAPMVLYTPPGKYDDEKVRKVREAFRNNSVNHIFDKDIVPRLPGDPDFFKPAITKALATCTESFLRDVSPDTWARQAQKLAERMGRHFLDADSLDTSFQELKHYEAFAQLLFYEVDRDVKCTRIDDASSLPRFDTAAEDDWKYFLFCHSFLPNRIVLREELEDYRKKGS